MEKKIYKSIIENIIEILDKDIDHLMNEEVHKYNDYAVIYGERNEYYNIIRLRFYPIIKLCRKFGWNNTYLYLYKVFKGFADRFMEDYRYLKKNWKGKKSLKEAQDLVMLRFEFRDFLRFEFVKQFIAHLKEDSVIINLYKHLQLTNKRIKAKYMFLQDIINIFDLETIPNEVVANSKSILAGYLKVKKSEFNIERISEYLDNKELGFTEPSTLKFMIFQLLYSEPMCGNSNMSTYELHLAFDPALIKW